MSMTFKFKKIKLIDVGNEAVQNYPTEALKYELLMFVYAKLDSSCLV